MILKEVELELTFEEQGMLLQHFFECYYNATQDIVEFEEEYRAVVKALANDKVPVVVEKLIDFMEGVISIVPRITSKLDLRPERTNHFIGWTSYHMNQMLHPDDLAGMINDAVSDYSGPLHAYSAYSTTYNTQGVVFTSKPINDTDAQAYFEDMLAQYSAGEEEEEDDSIRGDSDPF